MQMHLLLNLWLLCSYFRVLSYLSWFFLLCWGLLTLAMHQCAWFFLFPLEIRSRIFLKAKTHPRNWWSFISGDVVEGVWCLLHGVKLLWMAPKWSNGLPPCGYCWMYDVFSILFEFWFLCITSYITLAGLDYLSLLIIYDYFLAPFICKSHWTSMLVGHIYIYHQWWSAVRSLAGWNPRVFYRVLKLQ